MRDAKPGFPASDARKFEAKHTKIATRPVLARAAKPVPRFVSELVGPRYRFRWRGPEDFDNDFTRLLRSPNCAAGLYVRFHFHLGGLLSAVLSDTRTRAIAAPL